jgi:hypothetical protein
MSAAANAVKHALSDRKEAFLREIPRIEGEVNKQGGGVASLSSGSFVARFADEIESELVKRSELARRAFSDALKLQEVHISPAFAEEVKKYVRPVWNEETDDLCKWYQKRVQTADPAIAQQSPFESSTEQSLLGVFVDIENRALAPGFLARNAWKILSVITGTGIISWLLATYGKWLLALFSR